MDWSDADYLHAARKQYMLGGLVLAFAAFEFYAMTRKHPTGTRVVYPIALSSFRTLGVGVQIYAADYDDRLPTMIHPRFGTEIRPYLKDMSPLSDPFTGGLVGLNIKVSRMDTKKITRPEAVVVAYSTPNAQGVRYATFATGSAKQIDSKAWNGIETRTAAISSTSQVIPTFQPN